MNMKMLLIGIVALLIVAPLAVAAPPWDDQINRPTRFRVLTEFGGAAVLDRETGLVWEQSPSATVFHWQDAQTHCNTLIVGNRLGWRLPTLQELVSLIDPTVAFPGPTLPAGHPFSNVGLAGHWSATSGASVPGTAWALNFAFGGSDVNTIDKSLYFLHAWCVRGGQGVDPQ
jgi:hypothetical protein